MKPKPRRKQLLDSASIRFVCHCEARQGRSNLQLQQFHLTKEIASSASPPRNDKKIESESKPRRFESRCRRPGFVSTPSRNTPTPSPASRTPRNFPRPSHPAG